MDKNCQKAIEQCRQVLLDDYKRLKKEITDLKKEIKRLKDKIPFIVTKYTIKKYEKDIETNQKMVNSLIYILGLD